MSENEADGIPEMSGIHLHEQIVAGISSKSANSFQAIPGQVTSFARPDHFHGRLGEA